MIDTETTCQARVNVGAFAGALNAVRPAIATTTQPETGTMSDALIRVDSDTISVTGFNSSMAISVTIDHLQGKSHWAIALPAKTLRDYVSLLDQRAELTLTLQDHHCTLIDCGRFRAKIAGHNAADYPSLPAVGMHISNLQAGELKQAIQQVAYAAASDNYRPALAGVSWRIADGTLTLSASDGYRLSRRSIPIDAGQALPIEMIVPARALRSVAAALPSTEELVQIDCSDRTIRFSFRNMSMLVQLISGQFPDISGVIGKLRPLLTAQASTEDLLRGIRAAEIFSRMDNDSLRLSIDQQGILVSSGSTEDSHHQSIVEAIVRGEPNTIACNASYLREALSCIGSENIVLQVERASDPISISPANGDALIMLIMPIATPGQ